MHKNYLLIPGDVLQLRVKRTNPAHGTVTAQWIIQAKIGVTVSTGFSQYTGILTFIPVIFSFSIELNCFYCNN